MFDVYRIISAEMLKDCEECVTVVKVNGPAVSERQLGALIREQLDSYGNIELVIVNTGDYGCPNWECEHFNHAAYQAGVSCGQDCPHADRGAWEWKGSDRIYFEAYTPMQFRNLYKQEGVMYFTRYNNTNGEKNGWPIIPNLKDYLPQDADDAEVFSFHAYITHDLTDDALNVVHVMYKEAFDTELPLTQAELWKVLRDLNVYDSSAMLSSMPDILRECSRRAESK